MVCADTIRQLCLVGLWPGTLVGCVNNFCSHLVCFSCSPQAYIFWPWLVFTCGIFRNALYEYFFIMNNIFIIQYRGAYLYVVIWICDTNFKLAHGKDTLLPCHVLTRVLPKPSQLKGVNIQCITTSLTCQDLLITCAQLV